MKKNLRRTDERGQETDKRSLPFFHAGSARKDGSMFENIGKKLIKGATAEMAETKPIQLFDRETLEGLGDIAIGLGMLALAAVILFRKPKTDAPTIIINVQK